MGTNREKSVNKVVKNIKNYFLLKTNTPLSTTDPRVVIKNITKNTLVYSFFGLYTYPHP